MPARRRRPVLNLLLVALLLYVAVCVLLWWQQDQMVFPGAHRGDRGVPPGSKAVPQWVGVGEHGNGVHVAMLRQEPPRAVVLYFGGNGEDLYAAAPSVESLAAYGTLAIAAEHPGYGASSGEPGVERLLASAAHAAAYARAQADELRVPLVVVGSSLGSFCATAVAAAGGVDRLVLRAPPTSLAAVASTKFWWLPVGLLLRHRFDNLGVAPRVRCPVLVLHGDADDVVPQRYGRELAAAMPHAEFVAVPGRGHNDIELSPDGVVGPRLRAFLFGP